MAQAARDLGGDVTLLHGPVSLDSPNDIQTAEFSDAASLFELVKRHADADIVIMAAAVADFTPKEFHEQKVKKTETSRPLS